MGVGQERQREGRRAGQRTDERRTVENEMERQRLVSSQVRMARGQGGGEGSGGRSGRSWKKSNGMDNKGGGIGNREKSCLKEHKEASRVVLFSISDLCSLLCLLHQCLCEVLQKGM